MGRAIVTGMVVFVCRRSGMQVRGAVLVLAGATAVTVPMRVSVRVIVRMDVRMRM